MIPMTKKEYCTLFESRSPILNPQKGGQKVLPNSNAFIFGLDGMRQALDEITSKAKDERGRPYGKIEHFKELRREEKARWDDFNSRQANPHPKPTDQWADTLNKLDAKILTLEKEARELNKRIVELEAQEAEQNKKRKRSLPLAGRMQEGKMVEFAGRAVTQNDEGKNIFVDDGSFVDTYITAKKAERLKAIKEGRLRPWQ